MYTYTLAFIRHHDQILMINREKKPWMGCWNGIGGKLKHEESPIEGIIHEVEEETGLIVDFSQIKDCGIMTWNTFDAHGQGLYLFLIDYPLNIPFETPVATDEGILEWKTMDWITDKANLGVAHNIPYFLPSMIHSNQRFHFHCTFEGDHLKSVTKEVIQNVS